METKEMIIARARAEFSSTPFLAKLTDEDAYIAESLREAGVQVVTPQLPPSAKAVTASTVPADPFLKVVAKGRDCECRSNRSGAFCSTCLP